MPAPSLQPPELLLLSLVGLIAGYINVMAGGGSLLTMPCMIFLGLPGPLANGTNRLALVLQNATAITVFRNKGYTSFRLSLTLSLCALPGAALGALHGIKLQGIYFNRVLAAVMIMVLLLSLQKRKKPTTPTTPQITTQRMISGHILIFLAGLYAGYIQAGVGFIIMAILQRVMGLDLVRVNMHKVFIIAMTSLLTLIIFASYGCINWLAGFALASGNILGGWISTHHAIKKGADTIQLLFNLAIILLIIKLLTHF